MLCVVHDSDEDDKRIHTLIAAKVCVQNKGSKANGVFVVFCTHISTVLAAGDCMRRRPNGWKGFIRVFFCVRNNMIGVIEIKFLCKFHRRRAIGTLYI